MARANAAITAAIRADTTDFEQKMQKAQAANGKFLASALSADKGLAKLASVGGKGLNSITMGLGEMERAAAGGSISVTHLGANMLSAFAMGGGVGLAISAVGTAIGLLTANTRKAAEAAIEAGKEFDKAFRKAASGAEKATTAADSVAIDIAVMAAELAGIKLDEARLREQHNIQKQIELVEDLRNEYAKTAEKARSAREEIARFEAMDPATMMPHVREEFEAKKGMTVEAVAAAAQQQEELDQQERLLNNMQVRFALSEQIADKEKESAGATKEQADAAKEAADQAQRAADAAKAQAEWNRQLTEAMRTAPAAVVQPAGMVPASVAPSGFDSPEIRDLSPDLAAVSAAWGEIPGLWAKMAEATRKLKDDVLTGVQRIGAATAKGLSDAAADRAQMRGELRAIADSIARSGKVGVAGG